MITLENISFAYNGGYVLNDISEEINKGEFLGIIGPNGSGKTTLLRCLNKIIKPQKGKIIINNKDIAKVKASRLAREIAYVPQLLSNVFPSTVFDTILMGRKPHSNWMPYENDLDIVSDIIEQLDLYDIALKDINKLSGGQRQRVFIGRALAQQPKIILLDEPTANLDLHHQHDVLTLLRKLSEDEITVIIAIHDLNLAMQYCSKFLLLDKGKIVAKGKDEIFESDIIEKVYKVKIRILKEYDKKFIIPVKT